MYLMLAAADPSLWQWLLVILQVAVGLGLVIFVHELGHFVVAKLCGVKCEKFYIGFDIGGYKLAKVHWGETEYGVGILPLGGYVKMLGQDDNPARIAEENRRSQGLDAESDQQDSSTDRESEVSAEASDVYAAAHDPRSYLSKSVPQRMAIISAGVIMNIIFAFVFAVIAYGMGVKYTPCVVGAVVPGSPAWEANVQVGDEIVEIAGVEQPRFRDLMSGVSLGDLERGVPLTIRRPGRDELIQLTLKPQTGRGLPKIGVAPSESLILGEPRPAAAHLPAGQVSDGFQRGDRIVAVDGQPIEAYHELAAMLAKNVDRPLAVTVVRAADAKASASADAGSEAGSVDVREKTIQVAPNPMKRLGMVMAVGAIATVQADSPAEQAGLEEGDVVEQVDGQPIEDPMTLPDRLRRRAETADSVTLTVRRAQARGQSEPETVVVPLRVPRSYEVAMAPGAPLSAPALGAGFRVLNKVQGVQSGSPAADAGIRPGDQIVQAEFIPAEGDDSTEAELLSESPLKFSEELENWPHFFSRLQIIPQGMQVKLTVRSGEENREVTLSPIESDEFFIPQRGFYLQPLEATRHADTFGEAVSLGTTETVDSLLMVFRFLEKLVSQQISPTMLGGPITIAKGAGYSAFAGLSSLLIFLTMLSANLAVINFLPIPLLDGGHMVFLALEGVLRRPVSEKIVIAFHTVGFVFIIGLMLFVLALDFNIIPRAF
ncbi:MAG: site-2 protease family protein [Pirellulales bacterium]